MDNGKRWNRKSRRSQHGRHAHGRHAHVRGGRHSQDGGRPQNRPGRRQQVLTPDDAPTVSVIQQDMSKWERSNMWPFSCYSLKFGSNLPGFLEYSAEEVRWEAMKAFTTSTGRSYLESFNSCLQRQLKTIRDYSAISLEDSRVLVKAPSCGPPFRPSVESYVPIAFHMGSIHLYSALSLEDARVLVEALSNGPSFGPTVESYVQIALHIGSIHIHSAISLKDARVLFDVLSRSSSCGPIVGSYGTIVLHMGLTQHHIL